MKSSQQREGSILLTSNYEEVGANRLPGILWQGHDNQGLSPWYVVFGTNLAVLYLLDDTRAQSGPPDAGLGSYPTAFNALMAFVDLLQGFVLKAGRDNYAIIVQNQPFA